MNTPNPHFVVAGEALIDLLQQPDGSLIPKLGGSPWNVARALGRLGCSVEYCNPLSHDDYGHQLAQALVDSRVQLSGGRSAAPTSLALVKVDAHGQPDYAFYREGVADRDLAPLDLLKTLPPEGCVFHVGSLSLLPPDGEAWGDLLDVLLARGWHTSIDINMRPMVAKDPEAYAALARRLVGKGTVIKVSDEDLHAMGLKGNPNEEARKLLSGATRMIVLTLGRHGAWCLTSEHEHFQSPSQVDVVDTVGAGDCFYAGFLAELATRSYFTAPTHATLSAAVVQAALAFGNQVTAWNLQQVGCQPPWRWDL